MQLERVQVWEPFELAMVNRDGRVAWVLVWHHKGLQVLRQLGFPRWCTAQEHKGHVDFDALGTCSELETSPNPIHEHLD